MLLENKFGALKVFYRRLVPTLTEESWEACARVLELKTLRKGQCLLQEGTVCNHIYFINKGVVRMYYTYDGRDKNICFFNENNYVSDYRSFLTRKPSALRVQVLEDTELVATSFANLQYLYQHVPEANLLGRMVAEQLFIRMSDGVEVDVTTSIDERYNRLLEDEPWLMQRVPQYMIASYLGITPEAFSRVKARRRRPVNGVTGAMKRA